MVVLRNETAISHLTVHNNLLHNTPADSQFAALPLQPESSTSLKENMEQYEKHLIAASLKEHNTLAKAAHALGIDLSTLVRKKRKYQL